MDEQNFANNIHNHIRGKKPLFLVLILVLIAFLITLIVSGWVGIQNKIREGLYIGESAQLKRAISVTETGEIFVKPDLAIVNLSVNTTKKTVSEAMGENTKKMNAVIDFIKSQGVEEKDLKTASFSIYPQYDYINTQTQIYPYPPGQRVLTGYNIIQQLEVKIRDLGKTGKIIEGATSAGANEVGNLQFTVDKQDEIQNQARKIAIDKAKAKAEELASQLGIKLVKISNFSENGSVPIFYEKSVSGMGGGIAAPSPQIQSGESKISVTVTITYDIN